MPFLGGHILPYSGQGLFCSDIVSFHKQCLLSTWNTSNVFREFNFYRLILIGMPIGNVFAWKRGPCLAQCRKKVLKNPHFQYPYPVFSNRLNRKRQNFQYPYPNLFLHWFGVLFFGVQDDTRLFWKSSSDTEDISFIRSHFFDFSGQISRWNINTSGEFRIFWYFSPVNGCYDFLFWSGR